MFESITNQKQGEINQVADYGLQNADYRLQNEGEGVKKGW
jgi:hypothetical protein